MAGQETLRDLGSGAEEKANLRLAPTYWKSWALVVGISDYGGEHALLTNARGDAEAFGELLRTAYGFDDVDTLFDDKATLVSIERQLDRNAGLSDPMRWMMESPFTPCNPSPVGCPCSA
jgi:hypothetical protein